MIPMSGTRLMQLHYISIALGGQLEVAKYLSSIQVSLSLNSLLNGNKNLPVYFAASRGNVEVINHLSHVNDIHAVDRDGWSYLHITAMKGHLKAVKYLIINEHSFDPAIEDFFNVTPLHLACWKGKNWMSSLTLSTRRNVIHSVKTRLSTHLSTGLPAKATLKYFSSLLK